MSKTIYLLWGQSGDYEDQIDWVVKAFTTKKKAEVYKAKCEIASKEFNIQRREFGNWDVKSKNKYDPGEVYDNFGTTYTVGKCKLV